MRWLLLLVLLLAGPAYAAYSPDAINAVDNNIKLGNIPSTAVPYVMRLGFATPGDSAPVLFRASTAACSLGSGAGDGGSQVRSLDGKCWLAVVPPAGPNVSQFGPDTTGTADAAPAFDKACQAYPGQRIGVPVGMFFWNTAVTFTSSCHFHGAGWAEGGTIAQNRDPGGTWIKIASTAINPITYTNTPSPIPTAMPTAGLGGFSDVAFRQTHPAPGVGWTPTNYKPIFTINDVAGELYFGNLFFWGVNKGFDVTFASRIRLDHISGQFFGYVFQGNKIYDVIHANDWHIWPFWDATDPVVLYQAANSKGVILNRVDGWQSDHIFILGAAAGFEFNYDSDFSDPNKPGGNPTNVYVGDLYCDVCKYAIHVGSGVNGSTAAFTKLTHGGRLVSTILAGGIGYWDESTGSAISIGTFFMQTAGKNCVALTNAGGGSTVHVGYLWATEYNADNTGEPCLKTANASGRQYITLSEAPTFSTVTHPAAVAVPGTNGVITNISIPWTPGVAGAATAGTASYTTRQAQYVVHGNSVEIDVAVAGTLSGATGDVIITGFPFTLAVVRSTILAAMGHINFMSGVTFTPGYTMVAPLSTSAGVFGISQMGSGQNTLNLPVSALSAGGFNLTFHAAAQLH